MIRDSDKTQEELLIELAGLRARLSACEADVLEQAEVCGVECINEIEQLREAREKFGLASLIVENSPAVLFRRLAGEDPRLVYVSENLSQWGYSVEAFMSGETTFRDIVHPDDQERIGEEIKRYKEIDVAEYAQEYRIKTIDGEVRWISDETSVVRDADGSPLFNQGVLMDISRQIGRASCRERV